MLKYITAECMKALSIVSVTSLSAYYAYRNTLVEDKSDDSTSEPLTSETLHMYSNQSHYDDVIRYLYHTNKDKISDITYEISKVYSFRDWRHRRKELPGHMKITRPHTCNLFLTHEYQETHYQIKVDIEFVKDHNGDVVKLIEESACSSEELLLSKLTMTSVCKEALNDYIDTAVKYQKERYINLQKSTKESINLFYFKKDFWVLLAKSPKRSIETIYLKKGLKDELVNTVQEFFSPDTRDIYLSYGIPYKSVYMIYGPPGTGKTSTIKAIASHLDCDLYILPITKDMLDTHLIDAFSYINDQDDKERIIVIEDVDTMFDDRKEGDTTNGITLQGFLNCLDGFSCMEGTMLFITANKPEVLDSAIIRSCRIDQKFELGYADEFQTKHMFTTFFPQQKDKFSQFYDSIKHRQYTTAMLQEFFFYNRSCEDIMSIIDEFTDIVNQNDPKHFEVVKEDNKHCYL